MRQSDAPSGLPHLLQEKGPHRMRASSHSITILSALQGQPRGGIAAETSFHGKG